jgi:hypothetical protein
MINEERRVTEKQRLNPLQRPSNSTVQIAASQPVSPKRLPLNGLNGQSDLKIEAILAI